MAKITRTKLWPVDARVKWPMVYRGRDLAAGRSDITWVGNPTFDADGVTLNGTSQYGWLNSSAALDLCSSGGGPFETWWPTGLAQNHLQGAATDDNVTWYITQTETPRLDKCTRRGVVLSNTAPFAGLPQAASLDHIAQPIIVTRGGVKCVAASCCKYNAASPSQYECVAFYRCDNLALLDCWAPGAAAYAAGMDSISGFAEKDGTLYCVDYKDDTMVFKLALADGAYLGLVTCDTAVTHRQGCAIDSAAGELYVVADNSPDKVFDLATGACKRDVPGGLPAGLREGCCFHGGRLYVGTEDSEGKRIHGCYTSTSQRPYLTTGCTVWAWINPAVVTGERVILARYAYLSDKRQVYLSATGTSVVFRVGTGPNPAAQITLAGQLEANRWHLVVGWWDMTTHTINIKCAIAGGAFNSGTPVACTGLAGFLQKTVIGALTSNDAVPGGIVGCFSGRLAQIGVVSRLMSSAETSLILKRGPAL